jgi:hypothetical protein
VTERIPDEVLKAAHLRWCRKVAAAIIQAMAETGMCYPDIEARIGQKSGWAKRWLNKYIDGTTTEGREMTDLCCALGVEPELRLHLLQPPTVATAPPSEENAA